MKLKAPLILASQSPRRQQLLKELGYEFEVVTRGVEEFVPDNMSPASVAVFLSEHKSKAYDDLAAKNIVITADTIVAIDQMILGKPRDKADATGMILRLSGRSHQVITGVTISYQGKQKSFSENTEVFFRRLSKSEIRHYINEYKPFDKAGSYAIQEWIGLVGISKIVGDYYNVVGLPMSRLYQELIEFKH